MHQLSVASAVTVLLATAPTAWAGMYTKKSPVLQLDARSFDRLINKSNYTSVRLTLPRCAMAIPFRDSNRQR